MRPSFSFILCSVLVYATIFFSNVSTEDISVEKMEPRADDVTCGVDYLKRKGKLPENYEWFKASPLCSEIMSIHNLKEAIRGLFKDTMPTKSDCIMGQFEKNDTIDVIIKIAVIIGNRDESVHADLLKAARDEAKEHLKAAATACGLEDESKLLSIFDGILSKTPRSVT